MKKHSLFLVAAALVFRGGQPGFAKKKVPICRDKLHPEDYSWCNLRRGATCPSCQSGNHYVSGPKVEFRSEGVGHCI